MYVPSIGYCMLLIALLDWLIGHEEPKQDHAANREKSKQNRNKIRPLVLISTFVVIALFSLRWVVILHAMSSMTSLRTQHVQSEQGLEHP